MKTNTTPAGIVDDNIEFFVLNDEPVYLRNGKMLTFGEMDTDVAVLLRNEMDENPKILQGLELLGIRDPIAQIRKYCLCRYGDFDKKADLTTSGVTIPEFWDCGNRPCPAEGLICRLPEVANGKLTNREMTLIRMIARDFTNQQIAAFLNRSVFTINTQCKKIAQKIGCYTKSGIARFAGEKGIF